MMTDFLNWNGCLIGLATFIIIGVFHPLVIKGEYYWGQRVNILFLILGIVTLVLSLLQNSMVASSLLAVVSFSSFWSIGEVREQKKRVERGWFPKNPKRDLKEKTNNKK